MFSAQRILILMLCLLIGGKEVYASGIRIVDSIINDTFESKHEGNAKWAMPAEVAEESEEIEQDDSEDDTDFTPERIIEYTSIQTHQSSLMEVRQAAANMRGSRMFLHLRNLRL
jgi:hypothetical protein